MKNNFLPCLLILISFGSFASAQDLGEMQKEIAALKQELISLRAGLADTNRTLIPAGTIVAWWGTTAPNGWLLCNGAAIPEERIYEDLKKVLDANKVPDLRGIFLRGLDLGRGTDPNRALGSQQGDALRAHNHTATANVSGDGKHTHYWKGYNRVDSGGKHVQSRGIIDGDPAEATTLNDGGHTHSVSVSIANNTGDVRETRPINVAVTYIIKY